MNIREFIDSMPDDDEVPLSDLSELHAKIAALEVEADQLKRESSSWRAARGLFDPWVVQELILHNPNDEHALEQIDRAIRALETLRSFRLTHGSKP